MSINIPGKFGFGTMSMTWTPTPKPVEQSIETLKFVTSHPEFGTTLLNGGEFYGPDDANLKLFKQFLDSNSPELNSKLIISIKGGCDVNTLAPNGSKEFISKSIENIASYFPKGKLRPKLLFEIARVDPKVPYEDTISYIAEYVKNGTIDGISLSEVSIESIQKAVKVHPISCVELELSLFSQDIIDQGILAELSKHKIPLIAYSPLCRGILTDAVVEDPEKFLASIPEGDFRNNLDRFQPDNFKKNIPVLQKLHDFAHNKKNATLESLALSWILKLSGLKNYKGIDTVTHILPIPSGSTKQRVQSNFGNLIELSDDDIKEIDAILEEHPVQGSRYNAQLEKTLLV